MNKRGSSQIDWIVSMAIFMMFIAWFFVFITPQITISANSDTKLLSLKNNFYEEFSWEMTKFTLFIESNGTANFEPIIIDYVPNRTDLKFTDGTNYILWNDKLIFLGNISDNTRTYWLLDGTGYNQTYSYQGIVVENDVASTQNLSVKFRDYLPTSATYAEEEKFEDMEFDVNGLDFSPTATKYEDFGFVGIYSVGTGDFNHTSMVFWGNQEMYNMITASNNNNYTLKLSMNLDTFSNYYSNNYYFGEFEFGTAVDNTNYAFDYITLYGDQALTMYFDGYVEFNFTDYNDTLMLDISMPVQDDYIYKFVFHDGNYDDIERVEYDARFGTIKTIEGIYLDNITTNITHLQNEWNFYEDFQINIYNNYSIYQYLEDPIYQIGSYNYGSKSVNTQTQDLYSLDAEGNLNPINVNYRIW
jgi:hypothetical protein